MNWKICGIVLALFGCTLTGVQAAGEMESVTDPFKIFDKGILQVVGTSEESLGRYRALREAQTVAFDTLMEQLKALTLYGDTSVEDGILQSDEIRDSVDDFLQKAVKCGQVYHEEKGYAEVCMRIAIKGENGFYACLLPLIQGGMLIPDRVEIIAVETPEGMQDQSPNEGASEAEIQAGEEGVLDVISPYDGLIIDTGNSLFRPALVNRVLNEKGDAIFGPSIIVSDRLVETGCGGFAQDEAQAKKLIEYRGSRNPMIVTCTNVSNSTDAILSQIDAKAVSAHDRKTFLFSQARVVFIVQ